MRVRFPRFRLLLPAILLFSLVPHHHVWADALRLTRDIVPLFEEINLRIDPDQKEYTGSVRIDLKVTKATSRFRFHAVDLEMARLVLRNGNAALKTEISTGSEGLVTVSAAEPIPPGTYSLAIDFSGKFGTHAMGLYRMVQGDQGYIFSQFEPDAARQAFPCWDEPGFKIPFQATLEVPENMEAISNTPVEASSNSGGWRTVRFRKTPPLPSYLLAFAVGPLESIPIPGMTIQGRVVAVQGQSVLGGAAAAMTPRILAAMESYFGNPYPFEKLDLIAVPEFWYGAMENPGAITFADSILLIDPETGSAAQRKLLAKVIAHELAHMWFGDLVTMEWWNDLWLNESFADWMGDKIAGQVFPEYRIDMDGLRDAQRIMARDASASTVPIRREIESTDDLFEGIGLAYIKGKSVLGMVEWWMGPQQFQEKIRLYLEENEWGNADADDLWQILSGAGEEDLTGALASFVEQPGFPLIEVKLLAGGKVRIRQKRFRNHGARSSRMEWKIPVVLKYFDGESVRSQKVWVDSTRKTVTLEAGTSVKWIFPNAGSHGYYRWKVPKEMLLAMAGDSRTYLEPEERVALLGNLSSLLEAGEIHADAYLDLLVQFSRDSNPHVVGSLIDALGRVKSSFVGEGVEEAFSRFVRKVLHPAWEKFGPDRREGEEEAITLLRPRFIEWLGDEGADLAIRRMAESRAERYLENPGAIDPAMASVMLQLSALDGDRALWEQYRQRFESISVPGEKRRYLLGLGSFRRPELRKESLQYALEGPLRQNQIFLIPLTARKTLRGRADVYGWMKREYEALADRVDSSQLALLLSGTVNGCSRDRLEDARKFLAGQPEELSKTGGGLNRVAGQIGDCVDLRRREGPRATAFMEGL